MNEEFICVSSDTATKFKCVENVFHGNYFTNYNWWVLSPSPPFQMLRKTQVSRKLNSSPVGKQNRHLKKLSPETNTMTSKTTLALEVGDLMLSEIEEKTHRK